MRYGLKRTTTPANPVVTVDEAKKQLEIAITDTSHDTHLASLIEAATQRCEVATNRQLLTATYELTLDKFPSVRELPMPKGKLQSASIAYVDISGDNQTFADFGVVTNYEPGIVHLNEGATWPSTQCIPGAVTITFDAGYGDSSQDVPEILRRGILALVTHWFEQREPVVVGTITAVVPEQMEGFFNGEHIGDTFEEYGT